MDKTKIEELKREVSAVFALIQNLDAPMKESNVAIMNSCLGSLKFIDNSLSEMLKGETENGNADAE